MKNKIISNLIFIITISLGVTACFPENDKTYTGPSQLEFKPSVKTVAQTVGFDSVKVQLIGAQRNTPIAITYTVDPSSTAVSGTNYNIANSGSFEIPANSSVGAFRVDLLNGIPTGGANRTLVLILSGGTDIIPAENFKKYTLTITR